MNDYDVAQLARLEPAYQERLGLTSAPFPPTHEDRFLYLDSERLQRLKMLQHLTEYSNLLLLIIGERGIGKTSLMQRFIREANPDWRICQVDAHTMMDADQLLLEIAKGFGLPAPPRDTEALQEVLYQQLLQLHNDNQEPILIIDDAHELPQDALEAIFLLADVEGSHGNLLRILLFCEPQINTMLERSEIRSLRDRITHTLDIPRLTEEQTAEYIYHRLAVAGLTESNPFTVKDIRHIYKLSDGVPARINETAHVLLNESEGITDPLLSDTDSFDKKRSIRMQIIVASIVSLLLAVLLFQDEINKVFNGRPDSTPAKKTEAEKQSTPSVTEKHQLVFEMPQNQTASKQANKNNLSDTPNADTEKQIKPIVREAPATAIQKPGIVQATPAAEKISITAISPTPVTTSSKPQSIIIKGKAIPQDIEVHVQWSSGEKTLQSHQVEWVSKNEVRIRLTTGVKPDHWQVLLSQGKRLSRPFAFEVVAARQKAKTTPLKKTESKKPDTFPHTPRALWDSQWIRQQPGNHFTLQLLASQNKKSLNGFVQKHAIKDFAVAFETQKNNKPLYILILGSYPDRTQATRAISQLPPSLKAITPWIRDYKSIQVLLNKPATPAKTKAKPIINHAPPETIQPGAQTAWLWSQDPGYYTLQLMSGKNENAIKSFIKQHRLKGKAVYFKSIKEHQTRFVLVFGSYPNRPAAQKAIQALPASLQKSKPWVRSFASIHGELATP